MKITVLHGQMHKGSTYHITEKLIDELRDDHTKVTQFFMPKDAPDYCIGCFQCFKEGEEHCPHADKVGPMAKAIEEADVVILESPCYVYGMTGQLKTCLDHMGYRWLPHRPHPDMFHKVGIAISTAAGAGAKGVTKAIKINLSYWGIPKVYRYSKNVRAANWQTVNQKIKKQIDRDTEALARTIKRRVGRVKPNIKGRFMFGIMRKMLSNNSWSVTDRAHWEANGWFDGKRPWKQKVR